MGIEMPRISRRLALLLLGAGVGSVVEAEEFDDDDDVWGSVFVVGWRDGDGEVDVVAGSDAVVGDVVGGGFEGGDVGTGTGIMVIVVVGLLEGDGDCDGGGTVSPLPPVGTVDGAADDGVVVGAATDGTGIKPVVCPPLFTKVICPFAAWGSIAVSANPDGP